MGKKIGSMFVLLMLMFANQTWAHTSLQESTPADGEALTESIQELTLTFSTKVEKADVTVTASNGKTAEVNQVIVADDVIKVMFAESLPNESYEVSWDIIGADGHPMKDGIAFSVEAPAAEEETAVAPEPEATEVEAVASAEGEATESAEPAGLMSMAAIIFCVMAVVIFVSFFWFIKRKK